MSSLPALAEAVFTYPCIDNHCHNILRPSHRATPPLVIMTTEALGPALVDAPTTLSHFRARKQLGALYSAELATMSVKEQGATWEQVMAARESLEYEELCKRNFEKTGIQILLLDDLLNGVKETCYDYKWHDCITTSPTKRIVRLEIVAQDVLMVALNKDPNAPLSALQSAIQAAIATAAADPEVVGFKSIACYRTGLDITATFSSPGDPIIGAEPLLEQFAASGKLRIRRQDKVFEDWLMRTTLRIIGDKPLQFHTGLGDNDMLMLKSDPSYLQPLMEAFPDSRIILLHSSYPFTRQAGYLAANFPNVYLDYGEVFPQAAAHGQRAIMRELLEICPTSKLLWSTDAHHHPECYYLSTIQCREVMYEVFAELVGRGELDESDAVKAVQHMLFHNSNKAYNLGLSPLPTGLTVPSHLSPPTTPTRMTLDTLAASDMKYVRIQWVDYTNNIRFRLLPLSRFLHLARSATPGVNLTVAALGTMQDDTMADGFGATGEHLYVIDMKTLCKVPPGVAEKQAVVMGWFEKKDRSGREATCPRSFLDRIVREAKETHGISFLIGFETEFILLSELSPPKAASVGAWSTSLAHRTGHVATICMEEIAQAVQDAGIELQMFHAESAPGQYEIVTGPLPPLEAVDALVMTRDIMYNIAVKHGLKATLVPKPFTKPYAGSATHVHMSLVSTPIAPPSEHPDVPELPTDFASFMGGVLEHLPAVCAFTFSAPPSYARVLDGSWSGGTWVCWGRDNREAPLRLCGGYGDGFHAELKSLDGLANPYLAMGAVLAAGMTGIRQGAPLVQRSSNGIVDKIGEKARVELGISRRIPRTWEAARDELTQDKVLVDAIGKDVVDTWVRVKQSEQRLAADAEDPHGFWLQYY